MKQRNRLRKKLKMKLKTTLPWWMPRNPSVRSWPLPPGMRWNQLDFWDLFLPGSHHRTSILQRRKRGHAIGLFVCHICHRFSRAARRRIFRDTGRPVRKKKYFVGHFDYHGCFDIEHRFDSWLCIHRIHRNDFVAVGRVWPKVFPTKAENASAIDVYRRVHAG